MSATHDLGRQFVGGFIAIQAKVNLLAYADFAAGMHQGLPLHGRG